MWPFKRKQVDPAAPIRITVQEAKPQALPVGGGLVRLLPIKALLDSITGVIKDPNGKISSKRAGAGALVVAGIDLLYQGQMPPAIVCLVAALILFALTKFDLPQ